MSDQNLNTTEDAIRRVFFFLKNNFLSTEPFSKEEFKERVNYPNPKNFDTYFAKKLRHLIEEAPNEPGKFLVSRIFKRYSRWDKFMSFYSQSSKLKVEYIEEYYNNLMIFDFFLPLANEVDLKSALDELFYRDTVKLALKKISQDDLYEALPKDDEEDEENYLERICDWISDRFGGYSIGNVRGRFKVGDLRTFSEVTVIHSRGIDYIIDETTAIVKFIFSVGEPIKRDVLFNIAQFLEDSNGNDEDIQTEANRIRFFFKNLFVKCILELINGEDEIWMLERGLENRLIKWKPKTE